MKFKWNQKKIFVIVIFILIVGISLKTSMKMWEYQSILIQKYVISSVEKSMISGIYFARYHPSKQSFQEMILKYTIDSTPLLRMIEDHAASLKAREDTETIAMIIEKQADDENYMDENGNMIINHDVSDEECEPIETYSSVNLEELQDFETLLGRFYIVDSTTTIEESQLNYNELMSKDMKIDTETQGPKVLIYHTHSQEAFADSTPDDPGTSIVGMGSYLAELLNQNGIATVHDEGVYDVIDGRLDRSQAYDYAKESITKLLADNPSIEVVIDLHRDGVGDDTHLVSEINGRPTAKIMFFNGLSRSSTSGDIEYLYNPYIQDNLAFSFQMQLACEQKYPGWARKIYLRAYRYNLHLMPKDLLIEAGAQTNTVAEMRNAMELLADTLCSVLKG